MGQTFYRVNNQKVYSFKALLCVRYYDRLQRHETKYTVSAFKQLSHLREPTKDSAL